MARRNLNTLNSSFTNKSNFEDDIIELAGFNSVFSLAGTSGPDKKAEIHALNHFLRSKSSLTSTQLNHALILLSLENVELQSASTAPTDNFNQPHVSALLFDHPFKLNIVSEDMSLVPYCQSLSSKSSKSTKDEEEVPTMPSSYTLMVDKVHRNMKEFSTLEVYEVNGLLQELLSAHATHPYMAIYEHKHSESIVLVLHTGFDGSPVHTYKSSSLIHTKVGFQNYLQYIMKRCGRIVDEAIGKDVKREKEYELKMEDKQKFVTSQKEAAEKQQQGLTTLADEQSSSTFLSNTSIGTADRHKKTTSSSSLRTPDSKTASAKKKSKFVSSTSVSMADLQETGMQFEIPKLFTGYDLGDVVLLKESVHTTVFTADGVRVECQRLLPLDDDEPSPCEISLQHNGHRLTSSQVWSANEHENTDSVPNDMSPSPAGIPQPPPQLQYAALSASFSNSLRLSYSYYGPKANGDIPCLLLRPPILDLPSASAMPCPPPQQATSPKLNKKQLEQQQKLLEQQRVQEEKQEKERQAAQAKYEHNYNRLIRNNKYQQLFISTECGLNVHCHPMVNLEADPCITDGSDAFTVVKQWYSYPDTCTHLSEHTARERYRCYHPEGYVVKYMTDKTMEILSADGSKYRPATGKEVEFFHEKCCTPLVQMVSDLDQSARRLISATKVTFIDDYSDSPMIWFVTCPMGKSYLWQEAVKGVEVKDDTSTEEASGASVSICCLDKDEDVVVELDSLRLLKAVDPITKEVIFFFFLIITRFLVLLSYHM